MGCSVEAYRVAVGLFVGILLKILTKKAAIAAKRVKGLRVHGLAARFAVTTLLLMLLMAGVEPNPGPTFSTGEGNHVSDRTDNNGDNSNLNDIDTASNTADSNTQQLFDRLFSAINHLARTVSQLGDKVGKVEQSQNELASHIDQRLGIMENAISTRLTDVEQNQNVLRLDIDALDDDFARTTDSLAHMQKKVDDLEAKVEFLDTQSRRKNLLFFGIPRVFGETWDSCEAKVMEIIRRDMKVRQPVQIDRAHRVGSAILVQFQSSKQREEVLSHSRELRETDSSIYVREDFTETVRRKRSGLTPLLNQFRDDGKRAKLRHDKLITEDGTFTFDLKRQEYQKLEHRGRPEATRRYHNDKQRKTDFHSSNINRFQPRSLDKHNHDRTDSRFLRGDSHDERPDRRHHSSKDSSFSRSDNHPSRPNANDTTSDSFRTGDVRRQDSRLGKHYRQQHYTSDSGFSRRQEQHHHDSNSSCQKRNTQNYTLDVNKQPDHSSADNCTAQHSDIQHGARATPAKGPRPRGFGRGRLSSGSPSYTSPGNRDLSESPVEGIPRDTLDDAIASSTGNSLQLTSDEALTDAPDSGSVRSIQSRLGQFAYTGSSQDTMDHE